MTKKPTIFEKCLRALGALHMSFSISSQLIFTFIMLYILFFTDYYLIAMLLVAWAWYDMETGFKDGRRFRFMQELPHFKYLRDYFPLELVKTADLDPSKNYLLCAHPHGVLLSAPFVNFFVATSLSRKLFPGIRFYMTSLDFNMRYPLLREYAMSFGLISASRKTLQYLLNDSKEGNAVVLSIGGAKEAMYANPGMNKLILKKRKGFIKLALDVGCSLVPMYNFGENDIFNVWTPNPGTWLYSAHQWLKRKTGIVFTLPLGQYGLVAVPKAVPLTTVVGKPIDLPKVAEPTQEQIDHYHALYTEALVKLFEEHKHKYVKDPENCHLEIVE